MTTEEIIKLEETYQIPTYSKLPIAVERGEGVYVWDAEGRRYLDFYGGHCVALLGHAPPRVARAVAEQANKMLFYSNAVHSAVRAEAAAKLVRMAPAGLTQAFFANSGAEANEAALKLARTATGKSGVIAMKEGFHGRTLGSLAVTWNPKYREPHAEVLSETRFVPFGDADAVAEVLAAEDDIAAVILEPIQSIAGVREAPESYFKALRSLCDEHGVMLIFDEVQTGVGRTGTFSIADQLGIMPDLITLAKSLGAGVPVSAALVSEALAATVASGDQGSTFGGGMLAMAAVKATLETLEEDELMPRAMEIFDQLKTDLEPLAGEVRGRGCLIGVVMDEPVAPLREKLLKAGILTGSSADPNVLRLMPPLVTPPEAIEAFVVAFEEALSAVTHPA